MRQKGITPIIILVAVAALILLTSAGAYYYLKMSGKLPYEGLTTYTSPTPASEAPISNKSDSGTIEGELDATVVESVDADIKELETSASSL